MFQLVKLPHPLLKHIAFFPKFILLLHQLSLELLITLNQSHLLPPQLGLHLTGNALTTLIGRFLLQMLQIMFILD